VQRVGLLSIYLIGTQPSNAERPRWHGVRGSRIEFWRRFVCRVQEANPSIIFTKNLAIIWCDFLQGRFTLWRQGGCWGVFGDLISRWTLWTWVFQKEVYAILACSDYCRSANIHNMTISVCSDSKAALLVLSSYTISSKLLQQCWLSLQDLSNNNRVRFFWVPGRCYIRRQWEGW
jgi:hypothetical protein